MGNKNNQSGLNENDGAIFIKTDKPYYYSGETVTGNIFLNLLRPFNGPGIFLIVKGSEKV